MLGIDIYRYQHVTDWHALARHTITDAEGERHRVGYAWRKLTDGGGRAVSPGDAQVRGLQSVGIPVGGYHYAQFSPTPERQADVLLAEVERLEAAGCVPMLDLEAPFVPGRRAREFAERFCRRVAERGYRPGVYMNNSFARALRPDRWDTDPVLWIARYGAMPDYGGPIDVHQYSSSGHVAGIAGSVDLNWAYTTRHLANGDDMTPEQARELHATYQGLFYGSTAHGVDYPGVLPILAETQRRVTELLNLIGKQNGVTAEDIAAALRTGLAADLVPVLRDVLGQAQADEIAEKVLDGLADRLQGGNDQ